VGDHNGGVDMRRQAERYCSVVERAESYERDAFVAALAESLAGVFAAASRLPAVQPSESASEYRPSQAQWRDRFRAIHEALGDRADYWTTLAPHGEGTQEVVTLPLGDDLADIWGDLKEGLLALESGVPPDDVIWEWRFGFYTHWGRHATEALRALHARLADDGGPAAPSL
jgi:hypothetical protein